ncbi:hypothetical protein ORI89_16115 [Sphingobacterium sp. UT-1RO-CII-1]|uniref:hypothetical protein n=1 Tax=Sphingobacterium sp. UT-1RO-CII-1 TaxID=2995225 RepID=UPI00227B7ABB|nr:hypothetical protein [Sphingobacterium sp. UT-1RO-CII-1]MCY4781188.1 hypothetical protein [Sphingobacterium sp. UT-1RO-CII-1]
MENKRPISQRGDTLSYDVNSFAEQKDRSIGDVLSKLPGIDVLSDGRVLYQGRPIEKYYIEGMDLLEGKYNLANNNLPYKTVSSVEILENHQPIRVLDSLITSDRASLNIRLKEDITVTGVVNLASGAKPLLWEANLTPMLFKRNQQAIISYQTNNTGIDVGKELKTLTIEDLLEQFENSTQKKDLLSLTSPMLPNIPSKRFLDNNVHMATANFLSRLKDNTELRLNISYLHDFQKQHGENITTYFLPEGELSVNESIYNKVFVRDIQANLTAQRNTKNSFFKNSLKTEINLDRQKGELYLGESTIQQNLQNPYYAITNQLKWITPIRGQLFTFYSFLNLNRTPQQLSVYPGKFADAINSDVDSLNLEQDAEKKIFQTNNYLEYTGKIKRFTIGAKLGFNVVSRNTESQLFSDKEVLQDQFTNDLKSTNYRVYLQPTFAYKHLDWDLSLQLPVSFQQIKLNEIIRAERRPATSGTVINPKFVARYNLSPYWRAIVGLGYNSEFQNAESTFFGYMMTNYRTLQSMNYPIDRKVSQTFNIGLNYRNPIKSLFFSTFYLFSNNLLPYLVGNTVKDDGSITLTAIQGENRNINHTLNSKISKYYSPIKTTISVGADIQIGAADQLINLMIVKAKNQTIKPNLKFNTRFYEWITTEYNVETIFNSNKTTNQKRKNTSILSEGLKINIYPKKNQYIGMSFEHYFNNFFNADKNNFYADLSYRYTFERSKIDIEFRMINLFNEDRYISSSFTDFYLYQSVFHIRPRQTLIGVKFNF